MKKKLLYIKGGRGSAGGMSGRIHAFHTSNAGERCPQYLRDRGRAKQYPVRIERTGCRHGFLVTDMTNLESRITSKTQEIADAEATLAEAQAAVISNMLP